MDNYLIDEEVLGRFVDELIKKKPLPVNTLEELAKLREETIKALDKKIGMAIFGGLTDEQNTKINQLLDNDNTTEEEYEKFFEEAGINVQGIISNTMKDFAAEFLEGGQNA